ncbi:hypothetical protein QQS21_009590 [Conoideocrella luteorostrata]|uniref:Uncharacterized protein n=1 Tax=Conoideocrella luteorostrata TaxID=1105319 RepID=A0AAJ0CGM2_9HYPO|nr:hypothetical protein QQS21_009590 [Conoideocrella luteorostrata]
MLYLRILASNSDTEAMHTHMVPPLRSGRRPKPQQHQFTQRRDDFAQQLVSSSYDNSDEGSPRYASQCILKSSAKLGGLDTLIKSLNSLEINAPQGWFVAGDVSPIDAMLNHFLHLSSSEFGQNAHNLLAEEQGTSMPGPNQNEQRNDGDSTPSQGSQSSGGTEWNKPVGPEQRRASRSCDELCVPQRSSQSSGFRAPTKSSDNKDPNQSSLSHGRKMHVPEVAKPNLLENQPLLTEINCPSAIVGFAQDSFNVPPPIPALSSKRHGDNEIPSATTNRCELSRMRSVGDRVRKSLPLALKQSTTKAGILPAESSDENDATFAENPSPNPLNTCFPALQDSPSPNWHNKARRATTNPPRSHSYSTHVAKRQTSLPPGQISQLSNHLASNTKFPQCSESLSPISVSVSRIDDVRSGSYQPYAAEKFKSVTVPPTVAGIMARSRPVVCDGRNSCTPVKLSQSRFGRSCTKIQPKLHAKSADHQESALSIFKPLPRAPPEMSLSHDPVLHLNAQINSLAHRRLNIEKSIRQMMNFMPQDDFWASGRVLHKRRNEEQKVDRLQNEIALIQIEEHELSLKLFRAYKRQDKDTAYEPSTLWVRRIAWRV